MTRLVFQMNNRNFNKVPWRYIKGRENLYRHYVEEENKYVIYAHEGNITYYCEINKTNPPNNEQYDFEENYKNLLGEMSLYTEGGWFDDTMLNKENRTGPETITQDEKGWYTWYWDYIIESERFLCGGHFMSDSNTTFGDCVTFSVVIPIPPTGIEYVYINKRRTRDNDDFILLLEISEMKYLYAGMILRLRYHTKNINANNGILLDYYFRKY